MLSQLVTVIYRDLDGIKHARTPSFTLRTCEQPSKTAPQCAPPRLLPVVVEVHSGNSGLAQSLLCLGLQSMDGVHDALGFTNLLLEFLVAILHSRGEAIGTLA